MRSRLKRKGREGNRRGTQSNEAASKVLARVSRPCVSGLGCSDVFLKRTGGTPVPLQRPKHSRLPGRFRPIPIQRLVTRSLRSFARTSASSALKIGFRERRKIVRISVRGNRIFGLSLVTTVSAPGV